MTKNKSIAPLALAVSAMGACVSAAHAMPMPLPPGQPLPPTPPEYTYCLENYGMSDDGSVHVSSCDAKARNALYRAPILASGCATDQVVIKTFTEINIPSCPTAVQL